MEDPKSGRGRTPAALAELKRLKLALDGADDGLGGMVPDVEATLATLQLGVPIEVVIARSEDNSWVRLLRFEKRNKAWRLVIVESEEGNDDDTVTMLCDASREDRVRALDYLPELLYGAASQLRAKIAERERVMQQTGEVIKDIRESRDEEPAAPKVTLEVTRQVTIFGGAQGAGGPSGVPGAVGGGGGEIVLPGAAGATGIVGPPHGQSVPGKPIAAGVHVVELPTKRGGR